MPSLSPEVWSIITSFSQHWTRLAAVGPATLAGVEMAATSAMSAQALIAPAEEEVDDTTSDVETEPWDVEA